MMPLSTRIVLYLFNILHFCMSCFCCMYVFFLIQFLMYITNEEEKGKNHKRNMQQRWKYLRKNTKQKKKWFAKRDLYMQTRRSFIKLLTNLIKDYWTDYDMCKYNRPYFCLLFLLYQNNTKQMRRHG